MSVHLKYVRHGLGCVRPYLHGPTALPEFISAVFEAIELERHVFGPDKFHVELQIGDSVLVMEAGPHSESKPFLRNSIYVYVPDVDKVYSRALELGASSIALPSEKPYRERQCGFLDSGENTWWVSTFV